MNILLINQNWFADEFRSLGHKVICFGRHEWLEVKSPKFLMSWSEIKSFLGPEFVPDLLIIHDDSSPILITELETIDIPSVFYSVDTHHHFSFHSYLGLVFSHQFVAQRDYIADFEKFGFRPNWLPLWASVYMEPQEPKTYGAVFLGTLNPQLNPERVKFFEELRKLVAIDVRTAAFPEIFPRSQIVVNQTVKGDLNFRVFEAMMSGALLLTEHAGNGLSDLFKDGEHLIMYEKGNVADAAEKISYYLSNPELARKIASAGRELVCKEHSPKNRAQMILDSIVKPTRPIPFPHPYAAVRNFVTLAIGLKQNGDISWYSKSLLEVIRLIQLGLDSNAQLDSTLALDISYTLLALEPMVSELTLQTILDNLRQVYPSLTIFQLLKINYLIENNKRSLAEGIAIGLSDMPFEEVAHRAKMIVAELRQ